LAHIDQTTGTVGYMRDVGLATRAIAEEFFGGTALHALNLIH
jgi:hypothetical protein